MADDALDLRCNLVNGLVPGNPLETAPHALQGVFEPVGMVLVPGDVQSLAADISLALRIRLVSPHFHDPVVFNFDLQAAVLCAEDASRFVNLRHGFHLIAFRLNFFWSGLFRFRL